MSVENNVTERIQITEQISYLKASGNPLSADVILVEGEEYLYVFDVGNNVQVAEYLNAIPKKKRVILSHFHADHMGNIGRINWDTVYFGANTEKYFQQYIPDYAAKRFAELPGALTNAFDSGAEVEKVPEQRRFPIFVTVFDTVKIHDGVSIEIHHVPNSHAKGALLMQVNEEYIFVGDSLYSKVDGENYVYNAQLLKEEIELLKRLPGGQIFSSHEERPLKKKEAVLRFLEQIYEKREKNDAYIRVSRK